MRGIQSKNARRSLRAITTAGLVALAALGASTAPAAATPAVSVSVRDVTSSSASVCATGIRPAVVTQFGVYDGDGKKLAGSTSACNTVSGLKPATKYVFVFKSGRPNDEASMVSEGEVFFTTSPPTGNGQVVAQEISSTSVKICKTYLNVAPERMVVYRQTSNFGGFEQVAASTGQCTPVTGLDPSRSYTFIAKVGRIDGQDADLFQIGGVSLTTLDVDGKPARATINTVDPGGAILCAPATVGSLQGRYVVFDGATKVAESSSRCVAVRDLTPATRYSLEFKSGPPGAPDEELASEGTLTFMTPFPGVPAPKATVQQLGRTSAVVCGIPKLEQVLLRWAVFDGTMKLNHALQECVLVTNLTSDKAYTLTLKQTSASGSDTGYVTEGDVTFRTLPALQNGPTHVEAVGPSSATVCADEQDFPIGLVRWYLFDGDREVAAVNNPCVNVTGLAPDTQYAFTLKFSFDGSPDVITRWGDVTFRTLPAPDPLTPVDFTYDLAGAAALRTLTTGSLPLAGSIKAKLAVATGAFTGDLALEPATGKLTALGFLPVVAKVDLVPTDKVVGTLLGGQLKATAKVRIKLPSVKVLGIELAGGANCQAKQISSIALTSTQPTFLPLSGGPIAGSFGISDLSGCGFLTGLVSPLTKGDGNTIALNLTPRPAG